MFSNGNSKVQRKGVIFYMQCNLVRDKKNEKKMTITNFVEKIKYTKMG